MGAGNLWGGFATAVEEIFMNAHVTFDVPDARPGERALPHYNRLARVVRSWLWFGGDGIALTQLPHGVMVTRLPDAAQWAHPWRTMVGGEEAHVDPGLCNTEMPHVAGRALDGLDAKGTMHADGPPKLRLKLKKGADSWVVLRAYADADLKLVLPYTIEHTTKRTWAAGYAAAQEGERGRYGDFPLALLRTDKGGTTITTQVAHFNLRCRVRPGKFWFFV